MNNTQVIYDFKRLINLQKKEVCQKHNLGMSEAFLRSFTSGGQTQKPVEQRTVSVVTRTNSTAVTHSCESAPRSEHSSESCLGNIAQDCVLQPPCDLQPLTLSLCIKASWFSQP